MQIVDPATVRLRPGQSLQALFSRTPHESGEVGFFIRSVSSLQNPPKQAEIQQRAGAIKFNDVLLVVSMVRIEGDTEEFFDFWWNYHSPEGIEQLQKMSRQERITLHAYSAQGKAFTIDTENHLRKFFANIPGVLERTKPWSPIEFDRAVRGFCADAYPKENLWEMLEHGSLKDTESQESGEGYPGVIPPDLMDFYQYDSTQGHCIKVVPSSFEDQALEGNPEDFLHLAPVKTVLRCGTRWVKGYPVAPIPFIPGIGLAVPPDDQEL